MFKKLNYVAIIFVFVFAFVIKLNFVYSVEDFTNNISDIVYPVEFCHETKDCKELIILGQVICSENVCYCSNHSRYVHETRDSMRGCYTKVPFGNQCDYTIQCSTSNSVCKKSCENNGPKFCDCSVGFEFFQGICKVIEDKYLARCCTNKDCQTGENTNNLVCKKKTNSTIWKQCICDSDHVYNERDCIHYMHLEYCRSDEDCQKNLNNSICSHKNVSSNNDQTFGKCLCKNGYLFHENKCVHYKTLNLNLCISDQDCEEDLKNSYCENPNEINYYGTCSCKKDYVRHEMECIYYRHLKLCKRDIDCNDFLKNSSCNTVKKPFGHCHCKNGYNLHNNSCILNSTNEENNLRKTKTVSYFEPNIIINDKGLEEIYNLTNLERFITSEGATNNSKKVLIVSFFNIYFTVSKMNL